MKVAILGTRGIPAPYSGFETAAEQISGRLAARNKYLGTFVHMLVASLHVAIRLKPDVALFFIAGNSPLCLITRAAGISTVVNVDGRDSDPAVVATAYERLLLEVHGGTGPGPLPLDRVEEIERTTRIAEAR